MNTPLFSRIGQTRSAFKRDHALIAPDGHVFAPLPSWNGARGAVLISPAMGARLAQTLVFLDEGSQAQFQPVAGVEGFFLVLKGELEADGIRFWAGSFGFLPAGDGMRFSVRSAAQLIVFEKRFAPIAGLRTPERIIGHESDIESQPFLGDPDLQLQLLLPENLAFDMAVNIFAYRPGATLPFVETHVMEHGLLMLDGEGIYRLGNSWYPVAAGDSIWMAPFCPQWFAATGKVPARYIYFKNINRDAMESIE